MEPSIIEAQLREWPINKLPDFCLAAARTS
jgi:hypothetical protein